MNALKQMPGLKEIENHLQKTGKFLGMNVY